MARKTSVDVYRQIEEEGLLGKLQVETLEGLDEHGPMTSSELEAVTGIKGTHKRLPELREQGAVREAGKKRCAVTGRDVILWETTGAIPRPKEKKKPRAQQLEEALRWWVGNCRRKVDAGGDISIAAMKRLEQDEILLYGESKETAILEGLKEA